MDITYQSTADYIRDIEDMKFRVLVLLADRPRKALDIDFQLSAGKLGILSEAIYLLQEERHITYNGYEYSIVTP